ncbi:uncharacterized protein DS421_17g572200 [Arachis hypogaea]|nr:uncharacterized protein DS421_17g572200 [Arachis hypogaea]
MTHVKAIIIIEFLEAEQKNDKRDEDMKGVFGFALKKREVRSFELFKCFIFMFDNIFIL